MTAAPLDFVLRMLETDADWEAVTALRNADHEFSPVTVERFRAWHELEPPEAENAIDVLVEADRILAYGERGRTYWTPARDQWYVRARAASHAHRLGHLGTLLDHEIEQACRAGAREIISDCRSDRPEELEGYLARDFREDRLRYVELRLELSEFDPAPHLARLRERGRPEAEIVPLEELARRDPDTWKLRYWEFMEETKHDIPTPDGKVDEPYEEFLRSIENPHLWSPEGRFFALVDGRWAGMTSIEVNPVEPRFGNTGRTVVRRAYRQRGLARALKVHALLWARERGVAIVTTSNEADSSMHRLNLHLGFIEAFRWIVLRRPISP